jgi:anhydro-N-acetylmuramic acid kinase
VHHQPQGAERFTMQLLDPNRLAVATGIGVVADFRRRDMALGGQGAPLAPGFHDVALRHPSRTRVVLNAGGIANISLLVPGQPCIGFDTGPANILMDAWVGFKRGQRFDRDGAWAATGQVHHALLVRCLADPYFAQPAPKSTGREHFHLPWLQARLAELQTPAPSDADVQRTLLELTARTVADAVLAACAAHAAPPGDLLVCGGGAFNPTLLQRLAACLPGWHVASTGAHGIPPEAMEALAFAVFAQRTVHLLPGNLPSVTAASRPCVLGALYVP